ncbi:MAG: flippase-like domain-containing protein [Actinomycetota bacterium]|nr:flippase-like domain-containing protein [Actinomycetota bacterium]
MTDAPTTLPPGGPELPRRPSRRRQVIRAAVSLAIVVLIFFGVMPQITDLSEVWADIRAMTPIELASLGLFALWNLITYQFVIVAASPGLKLSQAFVMTQATTAISNTVPAGSAIGIGVTYAMYSSWAFSRAQGALYIMVAGVWNTFAKLALPIFALALLLVTGQASAARVTAGLIGIGALIGAVVLFWIMLRSDRGAYRVGNVAGRALTRVRRLFRRPPVRNLGGAAVSFREETIGLLRRRWLALSVATLVSHVSLFLVLLLALRHVGVSQEEVPWVEALAVFAFVRLITAVPLTPGGLGVVELGLTAGLVAAGGQRSEVVAAVLVYRVLTYVLPIFVGAFCYVVWRRKSSWHKPRADAPATPVPAVEKP